jgi:tetratricopeptide (TPR) repeat protein
VTRWDQRAEKVIRSQESYCGIEAFCWRPRIAILCTALLATSAFAAAAAAQQSNPAAPSQTRAGVQADVPDQGDTSGKKIIHDEAEYNAYMAASNTQDPKERAEAMEKFAEKYPKSVAAADAMEEAMAAWQSAGDSVKVLEVAKELIAIDAGNVRALAIVVALDRLSASQGDSSALDELCLYSTGGMREIAMWQKPASMTDADFTLLNKQMNLIFNGAAGYCALQQRNYSQARDWFARAVQADATDLQDMYQLAIADLEMAPMDANGFWYCARAMQLAKNSSETGVAGGMDAYCRPKYVSYHGSAAGWDGIVAAVATQTSLPPDFAKGITAAPPTAVPPASTSPHK